MKIFLRAGLLLATAAAVRAGDGGFSRRLSPEEFQAAGLGKLTAEEIARLDALVKAHGTGATVGPVTPSRPQEERFARPPAPPAEGARGSSAPAVKADPEAGVLVAPGTRIEFAAMESRLTGTFTGWEPRGVFALENGQRWREANGTNYASPPISAPKVRIMPGALGAFWMEIEGVRVRVKVVRVDSGR